MRLNLLPYVSKFLIDVSDIDIEFERQQLEAMHKVKLKVHSITTEGRTGGPVILIKWEIIE
jgi:hypothetical protein